jgi:hypothetical protein
LDIATLFAQYWTYLTIPAVSALVGFGTNWLAVKMMMYPVEFKGVGAIGWQRVIPANSKKMAHVVVDHSVKRVLVAMGFANLRLAAPAIYKQLTPDQSEVVITTEAPVLHKTNAPCPAFQIQRTRVTKFFEEHRRGHPMPINFRRLHCDLNIGIGNPTLAHFVPQTQRPLAPRCPLTHEGFSKTRVTLQVFLPQTLQFQLH